MTPQGVPVCQLTSFLPPCLMQQEAFPDVKLSVSGRQWCHSVRRSPGPEKASWQTLVNLGSTSHFEAAVCLKCLLPAGWWQSQNRFLGGELAQIQLLSHHCNYVKHHYTLQSGFLTTFRSILNFVAWQSDKALWHQAWSHMNIMLTSCCTEGIMTSILCYLRKTQFDCCRFYKMS